MPATVINLELNTVPDFVMFTLLGKAPPYQLQTLAFTYPLNERLVQIIYIYIFFFSFMFIFRNVNQ